MQRLTAAFPLLLVACGGSGAPTQPAPLPSAVAPPPPSFTDGWTGQPVGAQAAPATPALGMLTTVRAAGYLTRQAPFNGEPFYLWPQDEEYVRLLVYEMSPAKSLARWTEGFAMTATPELLADATVRGVMAAAAAEASSATGLWVRVSEAGSVTVVVDANDPDLDALNAQALAYRSYAGSRITAVRLVFESRAAIVGQPPTLNANNLLHELGHALGLGHHDGGVMEANGQRPYQALTYEQRERVALKLMYRWRQPGNTRPDTAPAGTAASGERADLIVD